MTARREWSYFAVLALLGATQGCLGEQEEPLGGDDIEVSGEEGTDSNAPPAEDEPPADDVDSAMAGGGEGTPFPGKGSSCAAGGDALEPNDSLSSAVDAPVGVTTNLSICNGDEDWMRVVVPAGTIARVGIETNVKNGDLDLVIHDAYGRIVGSRYGDVYPYSYRGHETNTEYFGLYSERGGAVYYVRVVGHAGAQNGYKLRVDHFAYADGASCTGAGFGSFDCEGLGGKGSGLLPFPFPDPDDTTLGDAYDFASYANYRFARRELVMLVRNALAETRRAFPGTKRLSLSDICQMDGITPGYDVGSPRHPKSTHDQGGNIDIAYFQTDDANDLEIVCNDGATHGDGYCTPGATKKHKVDLPRQAFFMAKLFDSPRTRVVGVDKILAPLLVDAAKSLAALPYGDPQRITSAELSAFSSKMAYGPGWPYHHHHIHLSMKWWVKSAGVSESSSAFAPFPSMQAPGITGGALETTFPPRR